MTTDDKFESEFWKGHRRDMENPEYAAEIAKPDLVTQAREALEGVTEGPWEAGQNWVYDAGQYESPSDALRAIAKHMQNDADARFIAAARTLVPELADEVERLRGAVEAVREAAERAAVTAAAHGFTKPPLWTGWVLAALTEHLGGRDE